MITGPIFLRNSLIRQRYPPAKLMYKQIQYFSSEIPPKPKPPPGIFTLYYFEKAEQYLQNHSGVKPSEIIQRLGDEWKTASLQERDFYRKKYLSLLELYKSELQDYENNLEDDERIHLTLQEEMRPEEANASMDLSKRLEFPQRPITAFGYFVKAAKEQFPKQSSQSLASWIEQLTEKWHSMNDEEKQPFREASQRAYQKFEENKEEWKSVFSLDEVGGFVRK
ncbi:predicted protein [Nematostella vectensis]|uniref:HMG box domain-containing protein n=1 Tax=Nematostella vectensis TaxID=45351 RepID=A7RP26_NEMVE|nr:high mobility group protein B3-like [Nematostella vectensis]EDO46839.1 predicted protein [Nematostella vectensis]|eukprot:XP_001638902.1 predicted protein [Nematostella vectensis]